MFVPIRDEEIPAIVELMNLAYRGAGTASAWTTEAGYVSGDRTTAALLRADIADKPAAFLLKWVDGPEEQLQGCVWLEPLGQGTWYLGSLTADPRRQNSGLGRIMLASAEDWIRQHGGERVRMTVVNVRETLIVWYVRRGYRLTADTEPWPYGDDRFGVPLREDLCFMVLVKELARKGDYPAETAGAGGPFLGAAALTSAQVEQGGGEHAKGSSYDFSGNPRLLGRFRAGDGYEQNLCW